MLCSFPFPAPLQHKTVQNLGQVVLSPNERQSTIQSRLHVCIFFFFLIFSEWYSILTRVRSANPYEMREIRDEEANPKNAIGSLDVVLIDSVVPVNIDSQ